MELTEFGSIAVDLEHSILMRYYLHGDVEEHGSGLIYCARCDMFEPNAHFYDSNIHRQSNSSDHDRYHRTRKAFARMSRMGTKYTRPSRARNIFA
jgi:hypothetical protein